jgi:NADH:ubiquinone oxidoreductase subunit B-like Fe-S oxidoreductase
VNGCDSIECVIVTVNPTYNTSIDATICEGTTYTTSWGQTLNASGTYCYTFATVNGCDSVECVNLTVNPRPTVVITTSAPLTICEGGSNTLTASGALTYQWSTGATTSSITVFTSGTYCVVGTDANGCQSEPVCETVTVEPAPVVEVSPAGPVTLCEGGTVTLEASGTATSWFWNTTPPTIGTTLLVTTSGNYCVTGTGTNGCFTTVCVEVTVNPAPRDTIDVAICDNQSYTTSWGETVNTAGTYCHTFSTVNGCDSIECVNVTVNPTYNNTIEVAICDNGSYTTSWGQTVNTAGTYCNTFTTVNGCDSIECVNVTVNPTYNNTIEVAICDNGSYTTSWGQTVNTAGTYCNTFTTVNGCDSIECVIVTVNPTYNNTIEDEI